MPGPERDPAARQLYRQGERERRPLPDLALHPDPSPMRFDGQAAESQAQPQPLRVALLVQAGELIEDALLFAGRESVLSLWIVVETTMFPAVM